MTYKALICEKREILWKQGSGTVFSEINNSFLYIFFLNI